MNTPNKSKEQESPKLQVTTETPAGTATEAEAGAILVDPDMWLTYVEAQLEAEPDLDDMRCLAIMLAFTREGIDRGPKALAELAVALDRGIERIFNETGDHHAAFQLFKLELLGFASPDIELLNVVRAALQKGEQVVKRARAIESGQTGRERPAARKQRKRRSKKGGGMKAEG